MDRGTLILVVGFMFMLGVYTLNMTRADIGTKDNSDDYAYKRQARQIAVTGVYLAMNKLRSVTSWMAGYQNMSLMDGTLDVIVDSSGLPAGQRKITSVGNYFGQSHRTESIIQLPTSSRNFDLALLNVQSLIEMQGQSIAITTAANKFFVNGNDWISDSTYNTANAKYGIGASPTLTAGAVSTALINANARDSVIGLGSNPSVTTLSTTIDMNRLDTAVLRVSTIVYRSAIINQPTAWGTMDSPQIVYTTGSLSINKPLTGSGILYINGNLTVKDTMDWSGYLIVHGNTIDVQSRGRSRGDMSVKGAVFFGAGGNLEFKSAWKMKVVYSSNILETLIARLFVTSNGKPNIVRVFEQ